MRLATVRLGQRTTAVRIEDDVAFEIDVPDVGMLLRDPDWRNRAETTVGPQHSLEGLDFAPLIPSPEKIICVGLNYRGHIAEMGVPVPEFPTLFAKYRRALVGATDDIVLPRSSSRMDWEAELAVVIGSPVRHASDGDARRAVAGYAVTNDVTARDWQVRTAQWLQGKTFEASTPLGPVLVTADEVGDPSKLEVTCDVDGETVQRASVSELVFDAEDLVRYISEVVTLVPGDVISTGTPSGVGQARNPPRFLADGNVVTTAITGLGECRNHCRLESW